MSSIKLQTQRLIFIIIITTILPKSSHSNLLQKKVKKIYKEENQSVFITYNCIFTNKIMQHETCLRF